MFAYSGLKLAGRGQGANQAMKDGGELAKALLATDLRGASDERMLKFSTDFDAAMYKRAFRKRLFSLL